MLYIVSDYDDAADCPVSDILQYPGMLVHNFVRNGYTPFITTFSPRPLRDVAGNGLSTTYGPMEEVPWLRTTDMSTPHYGIKLVAINNGGSANSPVCFMTLTVYYDFDLQNPK